MKRGVIGKLFFASIILIFLSYGIFATAPASGTCAVTLRADCSGTGNYILMGLSAATNAHGQGFPNSDYPYVLCCAFGMGNTNCTGVPPVNKVLGISSLTNAHAEAPSQTNYQFNICYEDLTCRSSTTGCNSSNEVNVINLSASTNAHLGPGFPTAICCKSQKFLSTCTLNSATWGQTSVKQGTGVYLNIVGSGTECSGLSLNFTIKGGSKAVATPVNVAFNGATARAIWYGEWQSAGILGGDTSYQFNASLINSIPLKTIFSSNSLTVKQRTGDCATSCEDYTDSQECVTDSPCNVATAEGASQGVTCDGIKTICGCAWDATTSKCSFGYNTIKPGVTLPGYTLCKDPTSGATYNYPGTSCPGNSSASNFDGTCDNTDSCSSTDCKDGNQASCAVGSTCSGGKCSGTAPTNVNCSYGFTLCQSSSTPFCFPGNTCPSGNNVTGNSNGKCEAGEGCSLPLDCKDGSQDSCADGTYCVSGKCGSIENPVTVNTFGYCKVTQNLIKDCNVAPVGYKSFTMAGTWVGDASTKTGQAYQDCINLASQPAKNIPCPAQVQLPFFSYYEIGIALIVIALIYVFFFKSKFKKRKKK